MWNLNLSGTSLELRSTCSLSTTTESNMTVAFSGGSSDFQSGDEDDMIPVSSSSIGSVGRLSVRRVVHFSERKFDVKTLPEDLQRVYGKLAKDFGEEYALVWIFTVRTAVELHRAWHMTLLTSKILQQIKDKFKMRMTWNLGVVKLVFRVEDGGYELHRKVPYDYDSEFQDMYTKIAVALVEGRISIHQALIFQTETKEGKHTAKSGLFLRRYPGRLVLYPLEAATCTVIFFRGDWKDGGVAAICGLACGFIEWGIGYCRQEAKVLLDVIVGTVTGVIGGLFYALDGQRYCLSGIFLGTLYWFFYGTAFVIGILEIIAGEMETGVTRFIAVSIKTFVLTLGALFGLKVTVGNSFDEWISSQTDNCGNIDLDEVWWRIPLYLLCSASALGQYRFPVINYWRGLSVQLVGYEVQYQFFRLFEKEHDRDFLDTAISNVAGAMAAVVTAFAVSYIVDKLRYYYNARLLQRHQGSFSRFGEFMYSLTAFFIRVTNWLGVGRKSDLTFLDMEKKLRQQREELVSKSHPRTEILLTKEEEDLIVQAVVAAENLSVWALLMPAVYQLVPGSIIALLWFDSVFPRPLQERDAIIPGTNFTYTTFASNQVDNAFANLMVIATSLALGLLCGFALMNLLGRIYCLLKCIKAKDKSEEGHQRWTMRKYDRQSIMLGTIKEDDPSDEEGEESDDEQDNRHLATVHESFESEERPKVPSGLSDSFESARSFSKD